MPALPTPLRVALVTTELRPGGAERCLAALALGLDRRQFSPQVYVLAARPPAEQSQLVDALVQGDVPLHFVGALRKSQFFGAVRKLRLLLEQQRPHVIQSFLFHANVATALASRKLNVPVFAGLRVAQPQVLRRWIERRLARRFARFVCVSDAVKQHAATLGRLPREKLHVIPNGIDIGVCSSVVPVNWQSLNIAPQRRVILFIGRIDAQKGVDLLLDAAARFLPQVPQHDLVIVGDGAERAKLQTRAQCNPLHTRIHFVGWRADAARCMAASEIVVLPSRYEGMANVLLEAMAAAKPVVATSVEGVAEVFGPLAERQTCPPNNAAALASAVVNLARDEAARISLGTANQARVAAQFSLASMVESYAELYQHALCLRRQGT